MVEFLVSSIVKRSRRFKGITLKQLKRKTDLSRHINSCPPHSRITELTRYVQFSLVFCILNFSPVQTDATLLANNSQHFWMLHVASVCTPCFLSSLNRHELVKEMAVLFDAGKWRRELCHASTSVRIPLVFLGVLKKYLYEEEVQSLCYPFIYDFWQKRLPFDHSIDPGPLTNRVPLSPTCSELFVFTWRH